MVNDPGGFDSFRQLGGIIPGTPGIHAFCLSGPKPSAIPVLIAVPHAGRAYPDPVLRALRNPQAAAHRLEDRLADSLGRAVARETGALLLVANAPRAMIDLNRSREDIDWEMFARHERAEAAGDAPSQRARSGLGLIPRRVPGAGELWKGPHSAADLSTRIAGIHHPYHDALANALAALRSRWGVAVLLDLHSMPPITPRGAQPPPQYVIGDRFGASCDARLVTAMTGYFAQHGTASAYNRPYAGGHVLEAHGKPGEDLHAVQIEIDRSAYLDPGLVRLGEGYPRAVRLLSGLVRLLAGEASAMADSSPITGWREAAE
jgi:N-formylglutamate amidohydrolase